MPAQIQDLGKLKRSITIEIPLEDIKSTYDTVLRKIKQTKLRGFRPGKFPKGWIDKRFKEYMTQEALSHVVPQYYEEALNQQGIYAATQAALKDIQFDRKSPLQVTLDFEAQPDLDVPQYSRISLNKQEIVISKEEIDNKVQQLKKSQGQVASKQEGSVADSGDVAIIDFDGKIEGTSFEGGTESDSRFEIDSPAFAEFSPYVKGMKVGDSRQVSFELPETYGPNAGKTAEFQISLKDLKTIELPQLDEAFFKKFNKATESEFLQYVEDSLSSEKKENVYHTYREEVKKQLSSLYEVIELPEDVLKQKQKAINEHSSHDHHDHDHHDHDHHDHNSVQEHSPSADEQLEEFKKELRTSYILNNIARKESILVNKQKIFERFARMAMMFGKSPEEFIKLAYGQQLYSVIDHSVFEEEVLNFIVAKILGEPIPDSSAGQSSTTEASGTNS